MQPPRLTTARLSLRPWLHRDEPAVLEHGTDPQSQRWTSVPVPYLPEHARAYVAADGLSWAVCARSTEQVVAGVSLRPAADPDVWDVGFWCRPSSRGQGFVPEALDAVCRWAFEQLGAVRLEWMARVGNEASRRVAEKTGFRIEGLLRRGMVQRGTHVDGWLAARLPDDPVRDTAAFPPLGRPTDGVVALRRVAEADLPGVVRACGDPETSRWLPVPVPYTLADARAWALGQVVRDWAGGTVASVAVVDAATDELLGAVALTLGRASTGEIGYWTAPHARGRGVAVRSTTLLSAWGCAELGLARVELLTDVAHTASQRVAHKAGFVREGVARAARPAPRSSERVDMVVWAQLATPAVR